MSTVVRIADAVAAALSAAPEGTFSQVFTAQRLHQPSFTLEELQDLHVSVVSRSLTIGPMARDSSLFEVAVDIGVQKKIDGDGDIDDLLGLTEEIADYLRLKRLADAPDAAWAAIANDPLVAAEHLDQMRQFTSVLTVTYRVRR